MNPQRKSDAPNLELLVSTMSLEEKIGQMTQLDLLTVAIPNTNPIVLDEAKLHEAVVVNHVGSFINNGANRALSLDEWDYVNKTIQEKIKQHTPHKIPLLYGIDSIHGATFVRGATLFPHNIGLAASRNIELVRRTAEISAKETRAAGLRWNFAPVVDVGRNPLWARFPETFGEDTHMASIMGVAAIEGFQGNDVGSCDTVAACMKHFLGYSFPLNGKDRSPAWIPENMLREYFLPPFRAAVQAGVKTVMVNSAEINGIPVHANRFLLTDLLRGELGFEGVVVSDWEDVIRIHTWHRRATTSAEAVRMSIEAGLDMSMVPFDFSFCTHLRQLVLDKRISIERVEESVLRILRLKRDVGLFENTSPEPGARANLGRPEYKAAALAAAEESLVLLKNGDGFLPLQKTAKILVVGPASNSISTLHGCWSFTWQGKDESQYPSGSKSIVDCIRDKIGVENVIHHMGCPFEGALETQAIDAISADAARCDAIVLCMGEDAYAETPGDINDLALPQCQMEFARRLIATGRPVVIVLVQGRCRVIRELVPSAKAILLAFWPGSGGSQAIANVLFGDVNPSGKLPCTYPRYSNHLITYDRKTTSRLNEDTPLTGYLPEEYAPQFEFGHGLSYTIFRSSNLRLHAKIFKADGEINLEVDVTNTGKRAGLETIEVYSRQLYASITPPQKRLRAFKKILLQPGKTKTVGFNLPVSSLAIVDEYNNTVVEPGEFEILVGEEKTALTVKE
jgi:beta-glucosidase